MTITLHNNMFQVVLVAAYWLPLLLLQRCTGQGFCREVSVSLLHQLLVITYV